VVAGAITREVSSLLHSLAGDSSTKEGRALADLESVPLTPFPKERAMDCVRKKECPLGEVSGRGGKPCVQTSFASMHSAGAWLLNWILSAKFTFVLNLNNIPHYSMFIKSLIVLCLFPMLTFGQGQLTFEPDRNVASSEQYPDRNPSNDPQSEPKEETNSERSQRIRNQFGDAEGAITLVEEAERNRTEWNVEQVREGLSQAKDELHKVKSIGISTKKRNQLAAAWGRLAKSERFLFGDTPNNLEWLRRANELDPDNEDVARALDLAERKNEFTQLQLAEAARIRTARQQQN
jgi:hypothetical protein